MTLLQMRGVIKEQGEVLPVRRIDFDEEKVWFSERWHIPILLQYVDLLPFTGFVDKGDFQIFDGHILASSKPEISPRYYEVCWNKQHGQWWARSGKEYEPLCKLAGEYYIVGDRYAQSDLLLEARKTKPE